MSFQEVLTAAVREIADKGAAPDRVDYWIGRLREAAETEAIPADVVEEQLRKNLSVIYTRMIERGAILQHHPGLDRFTLIKVRPALRAELDSRLAASRNLIKLNRRNAMLRTEQRFSGWSSSIPPGGSDVVDFRKVKTDIRKPLASLPFEERRVAIDQGHKFASSLSSILATDGGAIGAFWHSHWAEAGYDYRPDHKRREGKGGAPTKIYMIRGNWAALKGLVNKGDGYTDEMTQPAEEPFCRCYYEYVYALRDLPDHAFTVKGRETLRGTRVG